MSEAAARRKRSGTFQAETEKHATQYAEKDKKKWKGKKSVCLLNNSNNNDNTPIHTHTKKKKRVGETTKV